MWPRLGYPRHSWWKVIRAHMRTRPFVPFEIRTASGKRFRVGHPECAMQGEHIVFFVDPLGREQAAFIWPEDVVWVGPAGTAGPAPGPSPDMSRDVEDSRSRGS